MNYRKLWIITALTYAYFVGGYLNNTMSNSIGSLTIALTDDRSIIIDRYAPYENDMSKREGHLYSGMPPGLSFLLIPSYLILKPLLAILPERVLEKADHTLRARLREKFADFDRVSEKRATLAALLGFGVFFLAIPLALALGHFFVRACRESFGATAEKGIFELTAFLMLGTMCADFSATLYHTTTGAVLLWIGFYGLFFSRRLPGLGVGMVLGLLFAVDYPAVIYGMVIMAGYLWHAKPPARRIVTLSAGFLLPILATLIYQKAAFGSFWLTSYQMRAIPLSDSFRSEDGQLHWWPGWANLNRSFFDPRCSVLIYCPMLPLGIVAAIFDFYKNRRKISLVVLAVLLANLTYFTSIPAAINPAGGSYGARYTVYSVAFGLFALMPFWQKFSERSTRSLRIFFLVALAIPAWLYLFYGSPGLALSEYVQRWLSIGPAGYTLAKLYEAGWIHSPLFSYVGVLMLICVGQKLGGPPRTRRQASEDFVGKAL